MLIYLIGFMGSGKTTAGKKLATQLGYKFVDLDLLIEEKYKITIPDIFDRFDEKAFRIIEHETLQETISFQDTIISTGGGTPCFYNNMEIINANGISVYLKLHPKSIQKRLLESKKKRPLILNKSSDELYEFIQIKLNERELFYQKAKYTIKAENLEISDLVKLF